MGDAMSSFEAQPASGSGVGGKLAFFLILAAMVGAAVFLLSGDGRSGALRPPKEKLAQVSLETLERPGQAVTFEELSRPALLLHFWGTWCPPCRREFPEWVAFCEEYAEHPDVQVALISLAAPGAQDEPNIDREVRDDTREFVRSIGAGAKRLPLYIDPQLQTSSRVLISWPHTLLLDGRGYIRQVWHGMAPMKEVNAAVGPC